jgi:DNA-binding ferritin-like protein (Dps family)
MSKIIDTIIGDLNEKKRYRENEKRAKALPKEYSEAYAEIKHYLWNTGMMTIEPLFPLVDLLEEAAADGKSITEITGPDVAAFADELARGTRTYHDDQRNKLNNAVSKKSRK